MINALWYAALIAKLSLSARLLLSDTLRARYRWLASWALAEAATSVLLMSDGEQHSWDYARLWAYCEWPLQALRALAVGELVLSLARQYGAHNRRFLRGLSGMLALGAIGIGIASACWLECRTILWDKPLMVQTAIAVSRVEALSAALVLLACVVLMAARPLPAYNRNIRVQRNTLALWFCAVAVERYALLALMPLRYSTMDRIAVLVLARDLAMFCWLAWTTRPAGEVDWVPPAFREGYHEARAAALAWMRRELLAFIARVKRLLRLATQELAA